MWTPKSWDEFRDFLIVERKFPDKIPTAQDSAKDRFDFIATNGIDIAKVKVKGLYQFEYDYKTKKGILNEELKVCIVYASWDGNDYESVVNPSERGRLWFGVGIELTGRYFPKILDIEKLPTDHTKIWDTGREDVFDIDLNAVARINKAVSKEINRPVGLTVMCQFY